jgi:hypothetical protein
MVNALWMPTAIIAGTIIFLLCVFRPQVIQLLSDLSIKEFHWGENKKVIFGRRETYDALNTIIQEMKSLSDRVPVEERRRILDTVEKRSGSVIVTDIYPYFKRGSKEHDYLRALRDAQFIRPVRSGRFEGDRVLEMKAFGKIMLDKKRDEILGVQH